MALRSLLTLVLFIGVNVSVPDREREEIRKNTCFYRGRYVLIYEVNL